MKMNKTTTPDDGGAVIVGVMDACKLLGISWETWRRHVEPQVKVVRAGGRKLIAVAELERWLEEHTGNDSKFRGAGDDQATHLPTEERRRASASARAGVRARRPAWLEPHGRVQARRSHRRT